MQYQIEELSKVQKKIKVQFSPEDVNKVREEQIAELAKDFALDGYRKGKVPLKIVETKFYDEINDKATTKIINDALDSILNKEEIDPISRVQLEGESKKVQENTSFDFECIFDVLPVIDLPDLENIEIDVLAPYLKPGELEEVMLSLRRNFAKYEEVTENRTVELDDVVRIDLKTSYADKEIPGLSGQNLSLKANANDKFAIFELLKNMRTGEESMGTIDCPSDFNDPELIGKKLDVTIKLHAMAQEILPELDEQFLQKTKYETLDALKKAIFENTLSNRIRQIKDEANNKLLKSLIDKVDFEIPPSMIFSHANDFLMDAKEQMKSRQFPDEQIKIALDGLKERATEIGTELAKAQCFLLCVADHYKLDVSESEADRFLTQEAQNIGKDPVKFKEQIWQSGAISDIRERLLADKAHEHIYKNAKKNVVDEHGNKVEAPNIDTSHADAQVDTPNQ